MTREKAVILTKLVSDPATPIRRVRQIAAIIRYSSAFPYWCEEALAMRAALFARGVLT